jgi:hypothetical protein
MLMILIPSLFIFQDFLLLTRKVLAFVFLLGLNLRVIVVIRTSCTETTKADNATLMAETISVACSSTTYSRLGIVQGIKDHK